MDPEDIGADTPYGIAVEEYAAQIPPQEKNAVFYMVTSLWLVLVVFSFIFNVIFMITLIRGRKTLKKQRTFFSIACQLIIANIISAGCNLIVSVPVVLVLNDIEDTLGYTYAYYYLRSGAVKFFSYLLLLGDQLLLFSNFLIALHRLFVFFTPTTSKRIFDGRALFITLGILWILSIAVTAAIGVANCSYKYKRIEGEKDWGNYKFTCDFHQDEVDIPFNIPKDVDIIAVSIYWQSMGIPLLNLLFYIAIFIRIFVQTKGNTSDTEVINSAQISLLKQSIIVFIFFESSSIVSLIAFSQKLRVVDAFMIKRATSSLELLVGVLVPFIFIVTNKEIRNQFHKIIPVTVSFGAKPSSTSVVSTQISTTTMRKFNALTPISPTPRAPNTASPTRRPYSHHANTQ